MKRWIATGIFVLYLALLLVPVGRRFWPAPPRTAPVIPFVESRTGRRLDIPIEDYVLGVVAAEMGAGFPHQALAAQAMAARTYTLHRLAGGVVPTDDIRSFQAYSPERVTDQIRGAVGPTRGAVIVYAGAPIAAVCHACAGGRTAGAAEGLLGAEQPRACSVQSSPTCSPWLTHPAPATRSGPSVFPLRRWVRSTHLSDVRMVQGQIVMTGRGLGHGVGLSQLGASALAANGFTAEQIVRHYYHGVRIERRWQAS